MQLESFLADLQEGQWESSGEFTMDNTRALEKLKKFQFEKRGMWCLKVVQYAVSGDASKIEVFNVGPYLVFQHDGRPPDPDELTYLAEQFRLGQLPNAKGRLEFLVLALVGALGLEPAELLLEVNHSRAGYRLNVLNQSLSESRRPRKDWTCRVRLRRSSLGLLGRLSNWWALSDEPRMLKSHCQACPIPIYYNRAELMPSRGEDGTAYRVLGYLDLHNESRSCEVSVIIPAAGTLKLFELPDLDDSHRFSLAGRRAVPARKKITSGSYSCLRCRVGIRFSSIDSKYLIRPVQHGVSLKPIPLNRTGLHESLDVLVAYPNAQVDRSQFNLVDNAHNNLFLARVESLIRRELA